MAEPVRPGSHPAATLLADGTIALSFVAAESGGGIRTALVPSFDQHQFGGSGDEVLTATDKASYLVGGSGHDTLEGGAGSDLLIGQNGNDLVRGGTGNDRLEGEAHADTLLGRAGEDVLLSGSGEDLLNGGKGNDTLTGGRDADRLQGSKGDDILTGGTDADQFIFATDQVRLINGSTETLEVVLSFGHDVIPDFDTRRDRIDLRLVGEVDSSDDLVFVQEGGNVRILIADSSITLAGLHSTDLAANDFLF
ncbi:calcium-binding protein [Salipiger marinus]|uniref:calcium-binding protein n=1 Tax=Salipiger marinus TaxID=555512 RepID=UPI002C9B0FAA|nr:calcium-binding protein [Salipiger manganoxidans]MEB3418757.1 calcium-binding protein [Salipiger manganoxidans]